MPYLKKPPGLQFILPAGIVGTAALFLFSGQSPPSPPPPPSSSSSPPSPSSTPSSPSLISSSKTHFTKEFKESQIPKKEKEKQFEYKAETESKEMACHGPATTGVATTPENVPGDKTTMSTTALGKGAALVQKFDPVKQIGQHLCAFHYYAHDMTRQVEAHHYCTHLNEDMHQCLIYDTDQSNARLIGVEFIVSEKLFKTLPEEEKKLWHSHVYEVKSGMLFMPHLPIIAEHAAMERLVGTYGKTWHFWQIDRGDTLPLGLPQLMGAFTKDGQLDAKLQKCVEERFGVDLAKKKENREDIAPPAHHDESSDYWEKHDKGLVLDLQETEFKKPPVTHAPSPASHPAAIGHL